MKSINPYNQELITTYSELSDKDISDKIQGAQSCFSKHKHRSFNSRSDMILALAAGLKTRREDCARIMSLEMGKPIQEARAEVDKCVWVCEYYASEAEKQLGLEEVNTDADHSYVRYDPLGVILGIMPWNFPFWQVFRFAVPTIMAGNVVLLKHASNVQGCAELIEELFLEAGAEEGLYQNLRVGSGRVEEILRAAAVKAVSLTGSGPAGSAVAAIAGEEIKPSLLELGGSCGFIVLKDADLQKAASLGMKARMINTGQSCIAAKRFIVEEELHDEFVERLIQEMRGLKSGNPLHDATQYGPMARVDLAEELENQVAKSLMQGAKLVLGGRRNKALFEPAILINVRPGMPAFDEELFGPVAAVIKAVDAKDAVRLNNLSEFGLGVSIITSNLDQAYQMSLELDDGAVFINEMVKSDPRIPFGGTKSSGYGRELGALGIKEFVNAKTVHVKK